MVTFDLTQPYFLEVKQFLWNYRWQLFHGISGVVGLVILMAGIAVLITPSTSSEPQEILAQGSPPAGIQVYVSGAVQQPGVYALNSGQRISDVISQAGGFSPGVDSQTLHTQLNLASKVEDGQHIHIPLAEETVSTGLVPLSPQFQKLVTSPATVPTTEPPKNIISVNTATVDELLALPNIGEKRAADIVAGRPYTSLGELVSKDILTEKMYAALKGSIGL
jgi:competence protein ComEA